MTGRFNSVEYYPSKQTTANEAKQITIMTNTIKSRETRKFIGKGLKARTDSSNWVDAIAYDVYFDGRFETTRSTKAGAEEVIAQHEDYLASMDELRQASNEGRI